MQAKIAEQSGAVYTAGQTYLLEVALDRVKAAMEQAALHARATAGDARRHHGAAGPRGATRLTCAKRSASRTKRRSRTQSSSIELESVEKKEKTMEHMKLAEAVGAAVAVLTCSRCMDEVECAVFSAVAV